MVQLSTKRKRRNLNTTSILKKRKKPNASESLVVRVNALPLSTLISSFLPDPSELAFTTDDSNEYTIDLQTSSTITDDDFEACFKMLEESLEGMYKTSEWGWNPKKKRKEMKHPAMRYLLLRCKDEKEGSVLSGFLSFMITEEHVWEVVYIYEVNVLPSHQSRGLGKRLIGLMEGFGRKVGVEKAMLTVFYSNKRAQILYGKIGYQIDVEWSPEPKRLRSGEIKDSSYMILSKEFK